MNKRGMAVLAAAVTVSFAGVRAMADWDKPSTWPPVKTVASWFQSDSTDVLVVTGNYLKPRLLGEMIQQRNGAPILLFSPAANGGTRVFFMPAKGDAVEIAPADVAEFVKKLNPKKAVVLGDTRYVPEASQDAVKACVPADGFIPFVDGDWANDAKTITGLLKLKGLDARYARRLQDIDNVIGARPAAPAEQAPAEPEVAPAAAPQAEPAVAPAAPAEQAPAEPEVAPTPAAAPAPKAAEPAPAAAKDMPEAAP